jgi:hypothetical protein
MSKKQKLQQLELLTRVECIDYSPVIKGYVNGLTVVDAPDLASLHGQDMCSLFSGYTPEQLSDYAQRKFGFGINFELDFDVIMAINQDTYNSTDRYSKKLQAAGMDEQAAWSEAVNVVQHMQFAKPYEQWTPVPQ